MSSSETDLDALLMSMEPERLPGEFVFVVVSDVNALPRVYPLASVMEPEGLSLVLAKEQAEDVGLAFDFVAAWITLRVHSSLHAVGLTAAVSTRLAESGMSCNVIAGFHHDHLLVPHDRADEALTVLRELSLRISSPVVRAGQVASHNSR
ncbi:MAG: ACT domain-containing protein [Arachnia sp.]